MQDVCYTAETCIFAGHIALHGLGCEDSGGEKKLKESSVFSFPDSKVSQRIRLLAMYGGAVSLLHMSYLTWCSPAHRQNARLLAATSGCGLDEAILT